MEQDEPQIQTKYLKEFGVFCEKNTETILKHTNKGKIIDKNYNIFKTLSLKYKNIIFGKMKVKSDHRTFKNKFLSFFKVPCGRRSETVQIRYKDKVTNTNIKYNVRHDRYLAELEETDVERKGRRNENESNGRRAD